MEACKNKKRFIFCGNESLRLDVFLSAQTGLTRSYISTLNKNGCILLNGKQEKNGRMLKDRDIIDAEFPETGSGIEAEAIPLNVIYEDSDIAVINKQRGVSVHPSGSIRSGTLVNALLYHIQDLSGINGVLRPGIVHRLDKDTTGLMIIAKNDKAHLSLSRQLADRKIRKIYHAILEGTLKDGSGEIITGIARSVKNRKLMTVQAGGRQAITRYKLIKNYKDNCFAEFDILTGRTHQIRVHAKHIGHPVVGDTAYGYQKQRFNTAGQMLHARELNFKHPANGKMMIFTADYPDDFLDVLKKLENK